MFNTDSLQHIYQRTEFGRIIFYRTEDYLLYYTLFSVYAKKYGIRVAKLCLMINHIHALIQVSNNKVLTAFIDVVTSVFVKEYNSDIGRHGPLFEKSFGCASKEGGKKIRSCSIYIDNNPVEKKLCLKAEEYQWNFLYIYEHLNNSKSITISGKSYYLQKAMRAVKLYAKEGRYLKYSIQNQLFKALSPEEKLILTDYILKTYSLIDYNLMDKYFGSMKEFLNAAHSNTGNEYDIEESWDKYSYKPFYSMIDVLSSMGYSGRNRNFQRMNNFELSKIVTALYNNTHAPESLIAMFLHIDIKLVFRLLPRSM